MRLVRMIYASKVTDSVDSSDIKAIADTAVEKNAELGLTGLLCYNGEVFVQWLEGPRDAVNELYATILRDWRHERITILDYSEVDERVFHDWGMGFIPAEEFGADLVMKYSASAKFEPFIMSAESVRRFMVEFGSRHRSMLDPA